MGGCMGGCSLRSPLQVGQGAVQFPPSVPPGGGDLASRAEEAPIRVQVLAWAEGQLLKIILLESKGAAADEAR